MKRLRVFLVLMLLSRLLYSQCAIENNLVVNGDFESGVSNFTSNYSNNQTNLYPEGNYAVVSNPNSTHAAFASCGDYGSGSGLMMVVNGSQVADEKIWCQNVAVEDNSEYSFSTFITSVHPSNPAQLQFSINGEDLGSPFTASAAPCSWGQFCETWNSNDTTSAEICIVNKNTIASGNDFALDEIQMGKVVYVLPVNLSRFNVFNENGTVRLEWVSLVEENHDRYEVEKSVDGGVTWDYLGTLRGKHTPERDSALYTFYDYLPEEGANYYRLKMVSIIGEVEYTDIRAIEHVFYSKDIPVYPNPFTNEIVLPDIHGADAVSIVGNQGRVLMRKTLEENNQRISLDNLTSGAYYLNFEKDGRLIKRQVLIKQ